MHAKDGFIQIGLGVLFIVGGFSSFRKTSWRTNFFIKISKKNHPLIYWIDIFVFLFCGLFLISHGIFLIYQHT